MSVNESELLGFVGADPEIHSFNDGGKVANFSVATTDKWKDKQTGEPRENTEWHRVVARGGLAGVVEQYVTKGMQVYLKGAMRTRKYKDKSGVERYVTEIHITKFEMLGGGQGKPNNANNETGANTTNQSQGDPQDTGEWYANQENPFFNDNPTVNS